MLGSRHEEFLGSLPGNWEVVPIESMGRICSGGTPSRDQPRFWRGDIPWVTPGELTELSGKWLTSTRESITNPGLAGSSATLMPAGSILVTTRATIGAVAVNAMPVTTNQGFKSIAPNGKTNVHFCYHLLGMIAGEFTRLASGSTFDEISRRDFVSVRVPRPFLPEQRRIAEILDTADEAIQQSEALIAKLKAMKVGLLHDLLTRGLDAHGQLRDPLAHPEQFKESPLGRIPNCWAAVRAGQLLKGIEQGWSPDCDSRPAHTDEWGCLRTTAVVWEGYQENENKVLPSCLRPIPAIEVRPGDVLMTRGGPNSRVGVVTYVARTRPKLMLSDKLYRLLPAGDIRPDYLAAALSGQQTQRHLSTLKTGLAESQTNISQDIVRSLLLAVPSVREQAGAMRVRDAHDARIRVEELYRDKLKQIKKGLMHDLLTGRVRVML